MIEKLEERLASMGALYRARGIGAVRSQAFIKLLHSYLADEIRERLTSGALKARVQVKEEATILGSHKPKDVDVAVIHPNSGPLMIVGVRSQMSSVGKNVLTYYQDIIGECISLQDRFPMCVIGYVYLHPLKTERKAKKGGLTVTVPENPDHARYAKLYNAITGRFGPTYKDMKGVYDQFGYCVVEFEKDPPAIRDDIVRAAVPGSDLSTGTFVDRMTATFNERHIWLDYFKAAAGAGSELSVATDGMGSERSEAFEESAEV